MSPYFTDTLDGQFLSSIPSLKTFIYLEGQIYFIDTLGGHYGVFQDNSCVSSGTGSSGTSVKIILVYLRGQAVWGCP